jgi:hypothetical protein
MTAQKVGPQFPAKELKHWVGMAMIRWGEDITMAHWGDVLRVYQNGTLRAVIDLDTVQPALCDFADDDAWMDTPGDLVTEFRIIAETELLSLSDQMEKTRAILSSLSGMTPPLDQFWNEVIRRLVMELSWARRDVRINKKAVDLLRADLGIS